MEEVVDGVGLVPQERVQQIDEQIMKVLVPHLLEDSVGEFKIVPQEQFTERIREQIVVVFSPQVDVLQAFQFEVRAISHAIQRKFTDVESGKGEFLIRTHELGK